ncbi:MAG: hypothetical protein ACM3S1_07730 [Hyphomicrobiales bacterium]
MSARSTRLFVLGVAAVAVLVAGFATVYARVRDDGDGLDRSAFAAPFGRAS